MTVAVLLLIMTYALFQDTTSRLSAWLETYRGSIYATQNYRPPSDRETELFLEDLERAVAGEESFEHLGTLGYSAKKGYDAPSDKSYILLENEYHTERSWGAYIIETSRTPEHVIAAPHPKSDINSERIALSLWRETPGAIYMISGTHRRAADTQGDVTRHSESLFHSVSTHLAEKGLSHTQLHGFKNESSPDEDIIVSSALTPTTSTHHAIVDELRTATDLTVGTNWDGQVAPMRGQPNQLGQASVGERAPFIHIEMNHSTRHNTDALENALPAISRGLGH